MNKKIEYSIRSLTLTGIMLNCYTVTTLKTIFKIILIEAYFETIQKFHESVEWNYSWLIFFRSKKSFSRVFGRSQVLSGSPSSFGTREPSSRITRRRPTTSSAWRTHGKPRDHLNQIWCWPLYELMLNYWLFHTVCQNQVKVLLAQMFMLNKRFENFVFMRRTGDGCT